MLESHRRNWIIAATLACVWMLGLPLAAQTSAPAEPAPSESKPAAPAKPRTAAALPAGATTRKDVVYAEVGELKLKIDLYLPAPDADRPGLRRPVVMWIHGGGWETGSKDRAPAAGLLSRGYVVASVQYRLSGVAAFPAQIHDCKGAVRWLRAHAAEFGIDADRIGVWGASAGGHLAALLGTTAGNKQLEGDVGGNLDQSSRVQAVVDWFGPTDLVAMSEPAETKAPGAKPLSDVGRAVVERFLGGSLADKRSNYELASPARHVTADAAPTLIMHGDADPLVPLSQSELLRDKLAAAKVAVKLEVVKGAGHGALGPDSGKIVADWLDAQLKTADVKKPAETPAAR